MAFRCRSLILSVVVVRLSQAMGRSRREMKRWTERWIRWYCPAFKASYTFTCGLTAPGRVIPWKKPKETFSQTEFKGFLRGQGFHFLVPLDFSPPGEPMLNTLRVKYAWHQRYKRGKRSNTAQLSLEPLLNSIHEAVWGLSTEITWLTLEIPAKKEFVEIGRDGIHFRIAAHMEEIVGREGSMRDFRAPNQGE